MLTILVFIIILGLLIFAHEFGHFLAARRNGIKTEEFGFGFPPRILGYVKNDKNGKYKIILGDKKIVSKNTIFSLNWIPLGGFVKIKGESGEAKSDEDSFAGKSAWTRVKVLVAGVIMNFILAWALISIGLMIGAPQPVRDSDKLAKNPKIQVNQIIPGAPAEKMNLKIGDEIIKCQMPIPRCQKKFSSIADIQNVINGYKGKEIIFQIKRGGEILEIKGVPRTEYPADQGPLGISLVKTALIAYPWYQAIWEGLKTTYEICIAIFSILGNIIKDFFTGKKVSVEVTGPVGIAILTKQVTGLGLVYILQFAALLRINLGIINGLPFPALDGGRILFILIEKIKGSPVSQKIERAFHTIGFVLLITLMIVVTFKDFIRFDLIEKIKGIF